MEVCGFERVFSRLILMGVVCVVVVVVSVRGRVVRWNEVMMLFFVVGCVGVRG